MVYHVRAGERAKSCWYPTYPESALRQLISSVGHRHREDRPDTWWPSVPRRTLVVFTMPPHTTALLILTDSDAADPILSAVQHPIRDKLDVPPGDASRA